jgi:hypothetical protein
MSMVSDVPSVVMDDGFVLTLNQVIRNSNLCYHIILDKNSEQFALVKSDSINSSNFAFSGMQTSRSKTSVVCNYATRSEGITKMADPGSISQIQDKNIFEKVVDTQ